MNRSFKSQKFVLLFVWGILLILVSVRLFFYEPLTIPKNSDVKLEVLVDEVTASEGSQRIEVADIVVFAPLYPTIGVGDRLIVAGKVDHEGKMFNADIELIGHEKSISSYLWVFRQEVVSRVESLLPPREATLVAGTVLGVDKIGRDFRDELIQTGTIHVVVVSGQNLAIVAGIFLALVKYLGRRVAMVLAIGACLLYALLTGFEAPVVRALLMVVATTLALFFGRATSALISLFVAAVVIIIVWPDSITSISFQLTFAATLGIVTLGARLQKVLKVPVIGEITAVSVSAFLFTAPVILYHFGRISLLSPLVNVLVSEAVFPIMILGFVVSILSLIFMPAAQLFAYLVFVPAHYFVEVVGFFSRFDAATVEGYSGNLLILALFAIFASGLFLIWRKT